MTRVLAAGDRFVLTSLFVDALRREVAADLEIRGPELEDSTVGLVGYGAIGSRRADGRGPRRARRRARPVRRPGGPRRPTRLP